MIYNLRIERGIRSPNGLTTPIGACHLEPDDPHQATATAIGTPLGINTHLGLTSTYT